MESDRGAESASHTSPIRDWVAEVMGAAAFFRSAYRELLRTAMYAGTSQHEAEDAVAQALLEMLPRWAGIDDPAAYARTAVLRNVIREKIRGVDHPHRQVPSRADTAEGGADPNLSIWEDREWVLGMLRSPPEGQRQVMAFVVDGFTAAEISALVGRSPDAIRQAVCAARLHLKAMLRRDQIDEQTPLQGGDSVRKESR